MASIKKGYSEKHDQHPNWLYCKAFDVHLRVTMFRRFAYMVVLSSEKVCDTFGECYGMAYCGYALRTSFDLKKETQYTFIFGGGRVELPRTLTEASRVRMHNRFPLNIESYSFDHDFHLFKKNGIQLYAHYYRGMLRICVSSGRSEYVKDVINGTVNKLYVRIHPEGALRQIVKKNLYDLCDVFEFLKWNFEMKMNWWQMMQSSDNVNRELALNMLMPYFDEISNRNKTS